MPGHRLCHVGLALVRVGLLRPLGDQDEQDSTQSTQRAANEREETGGRLAGLRLHAFFQMTRSAIGVTATFAFQLWPFACLALKAGVAPPRPGRRQRAVVVDPDLCRQATYHQGLTEPKNIHCLIAIPNVSEKFTAFA